MIELLEVFDDVRASQFFIENLRCEKLESCGKSDGLGMLK